MITSRLSDCAWRWDIWLYIETVCILICIWCLLSNLSFLYHHKIWHPSPESWGLRQGNKRYMERKRGALYLTFSHVLRTLQLFVILFTVFWQYADLQLNWDTCTVTNGCSSIRVIYVAFAFTILLYYQYGVYRSKMLLFFRVQNSYSHWLQRLGFLCHLSFLILAIVIQFYIDPMQEENGICDWDKNPKQWSYALYIATGNVIFTELLNLCLFVYPLHKISSDKKLSKIESITARSITWLIIRSTATSMTTTLGTLIFLIWWGSGFPNLWQKIKPFTLFMVLGLAQYFAMSFSYLYWDYIFCPKVLSIRETRLYAHLRGRRRSSIKVLEELDEDFISEDRLEQKCELKPPLTNLTIHSISTMDRSAESSIISLTSSATTRVFLKPSVHQMTTPRRQIGRERNKNYHNVFERLGESKLPYQALTDVPSDHQNLQIPDSSNVRRNFSLSEQKPSRWSDTYPLGRSSSSPKPNSHDRIIKFSENLELSLGYPHYNKRQGARSYCQQSSLLSTPRTYGS